MNRLRAFIKKEFYHIIRDWRTLIILIGMPMAQIILFGFAITNEVNEAKIGILDKAKDEESRNIINKIDASSYLDITEYLSTDEEIEKVFKKGNVKEIIVFPADFGRDLWANNQADIQVVSDATDPNTADLIFNYTRAIILNHLNEMNANIESPFQIEINQQMLYNPALKGVYLFVPGLITVILMLISAMMTSISITKEKELGTMEVLLATPMAPVQVVLAKVIPYLLLAFIDAVLVLLLGYFVFDVPIRGSLVLLLFETLVFIVTALSLGVFISTRTSSQQVALMISLMLLMLPTILLSGFIFPIENMPNPLQIISNIVPARWFVIILKGIMLKGLGIAAIWEETLILIGFIVFFIALSVKNYKIRLT
ncbi:MAG TPA: multidrug ABC transporter permease [Cytophagales bacterium]|nr:multidrug ABC transporter permease [Cytophagales bacterium]